MGRWKLDPANSDPSGITKDPSGGTDLWVVDRADRLVYHYTAATTQRAGSVTVADTFGLVGANIQPEGIADPPTSPIDVGVFTPIDGSSMVAGIPLLIAGHALPGTSSEPVVAVSVNNTPVDAIDAAGNFFAQVTVAPGQNAYSVVARNAAGETSTAAITVQGAGASAAASDFSDLEDVTGSLGPEYGRTSFHESTGVLYADLAIRNAGSYPADVPLLVGITNISDPTVRLRGFDGETPEGIPYFDLSDMVPGNTLEPGGATGLRTLMFYNPNRQQFTYDPITFGPRFAFRSLMPEGGV